MGVIGQHGPLVTLVGGPASQHGPDRAPDGNADDEADPEGSGPPRVAEPVQPPARVDAQPGQRRDQDRLGVSANRAALASGSPNGVYCSGPCGRAGGLAAGGAGLVGVGQADLRGQGPHPVGVGDEDQTVDRAGR